MENVTITLDPHGDGREFDLIVHDPVALRQASALSIVTKDKCTIAGKPGAVLSWAAEDPKTGRLHIAQAVTTVNLLKGTLRALMGKYPDDADVKMTPDEVREGAFQLLGSVIPAMNRAVQIRDWRSVDASMQLLVRMAEDLRQRGGGPAR